MGASSVVDNFSVTGFYTCSFLSHEIRKSLQKAMFKTCGPCRCPLFHNLHNDQVANKKENPEQEFTLLESLCEMGHSPSTESATDGGINAAAARGGSSL